MPPITISQSLAAAQRLLQQGGLRVIDISDKPVQAEVLRDGVKVPPVQIREDLVADFVADDRLDGRIIQQRVIYQSVQPEARVPRGTVVDLVLSSPFLIGTDFVAGSHADLAEQSIGQVGEIFLQDDALRREVQLAERYVDLTPGAQEAIQSAARNAQINLEDNDPQRDPQALYVAIKAADAYG
jgi:hypothetical protein